MSRACTHVCECEYTRIWTDIHKILSLFVTGHLPTYTYCSIKHTQTHTSETCRVWMPCVHWEIRIRYSLYAVPHNITCCGSVACNVSNHILQIEHLLPSPSQTLHRYATWGYPCVSHQKRLIQLLNYTLSLWTIFSTSTCTRSCVHGNYRAWMVFL